MDLKAVFRLVDVDKSGSISRTVRLEFNMKSPETDFDRNLDKNSGILSKAKKNIYD